MELTFFASGDGALIIEAEQAVPEISVSPEGEITASATQAAGYVPAGTKSAAKQLPVQSAKTVTPSTEEQTAVEAGVYTTGAVKVAAVEAAEQATPEVTVSEGGLITVSADQAAGYVPAGTKSATLQLPTKGGGIITPSASYQHVVSEGHYTTGVITVAGDANLKAENIAEGVSVFGVTGTHKSGGGPGTCALTIDADDTWNVLTVKGTVIGEDGQAVWSDSIPMYSKASAFNDTCDVLPGSTVWIAVDDTWDYGAMIWEGCEYVGVFDGSYIGGDYYSRYFVVLITAAAGESATLDM